MRTGNIKSRSYADPIERVITPIVGESMTRQDQADSANINVIYAKTQRGEIVLAKDVMPTFGDFSNELSYDQMLEAIQEAEDAFLSLPSSEREKYGHDPSKYYEAVGKEAVTSLKNQEAKEKADLAEKTKAEEIEKAKQLLGENKESS